MTTDKTNVLAIKQVERIIKNAGADRISEDASAELEKELVDYGTKISKEAISVAVGTKRQTVKSEDIRLAIENIKTKNEIVLSKEYGAPIENRKQEIIAYLNNGQFHHAHSSMIALLKSAGCGTKL